MAAAKRFTDGYWRYSLTAYAATDVRALSLHLQDDYKANVNLLLLGGFVGHSGQMLAARDWSSIAERIAPFNRRYTQRIRNLRQRVQPLTAAECYQQLKTLELQAEQLEQQIIATACDPSMYSMPITRQNGVPENQVLPNLLAYHASWSLKSAEAENLVCELAAALLRGDTIKRNQSQR